jgi:hypothetical protein
MLICSVSSVRRTGKEYQVILTTLVDMQQTDAVAGDGMSVRGNKKIKQGEIPKTGIGD